MNIDQQWLASQFPDLSSIAPIGHGGQKLVFSASHPTDGAVVLKLIKPTQSVESVTREIHAVQQVQSSRVPRILEHGSVATAIGPCFWIREQRIDGTTVRQILQRGKLAERDALKLGLHMLEALTQAENVKIVHRDVKPDNIMMDQQGDFWLLDFGVARHLSLDSLTATAAMFGKFTWGYAPVEQCRNDKPSIDSRADLFALGVTLHECLTGTNAFRAGARDEMEILKRLSGMALPPLQLTLGTSAEVQDLVSALTQKRRDQRPNSVQYSLDWMRAICTAEQI